MNKYVKYYKSYVYSVINYLKYVNFLDFFTITQPVVLSGVHRPVFLAVNKAVLVSLKDYNPINTEHDSAEFCLIPQEDCYDH